MQGRALLHPVEIFPRPLRQPLHHRGGGRRLFRRKGKGIGLLRKKLPIAAEKLELVERARPGTRKENLPDANSGMQPHGVAPPVPMIEGAHNTDPTGIWRPDGEAGASHALPRQRVGSQDLVKPVMPAFTQEMQVEFAEGRGKAVAVLFFPLVVSSREAQPITWDSFAVGKQALEEAPRMSTLQRDRGPAAFRIDRLHLLGIRSEDPEHKALRAGMRSENGKGVAVTTRYQRPNRMITAEAPAVLALADHSVSLWMRSNRPMIGIATQSGRFESS